MLKPRHLIGWVLGASTLAVVACAPERSALHEAVAGEGGRRLMARLVGFPHAPFVEAAQAPAALAPQLSRSLAGLERSGEVPEADLRHQEGLVLLLLDRHDRAVEKLDRAAALAPGRAELRSDLGAAYLARARAKGEPLDLIEALAAVEAAAELPGPPPEALFNRALLRGELALRRSARRAWNDYLEVESEGPWAEEARQRLAELDRLTEDELWQAAKDEIKSAFARGDAGEMQRQVDRHRREARRWAEAELLPAWAEAQLEDDGERAADRLALAREIGGTLVDLGGDRLLAGSVAAIDAAQLERDMDRLAEAHRLYGEGAELIGARRFTEAEAPLEAARRLLSAAGSPFELRALFLLERCAYHRADAEALTALASRIVAASHGRRYGSVVGRALWVRGTSEMVLGRVGRALPFYRLALGHAEAAGERRNALALRALLATTHAELGDAEGFWLRALEVCAELRRFPEDRRLRLMLMPLVYEAAELGELGVALGFQAEALEIAEEADEPQGVATAYLHRAALHERAGEPERALDDLEVADRQAERVADARERSSLRGDVELARGRSLRSRDPAAALAALDRGQEIYRRDDNRILLPRLHLERGRTLLVLGRVEEAGRELAEAIDELERQRGDLGTVQHRVGFFDRVHDFFEERVAFQVEHEGDDLGALETSERGRARALRDALEGAGSAAPMAIEDLLSSFPAGKVGVVYEVLPERVLAWVVRRGEARRSELGLATARLRELLGRLGEVAVPGRSEDGGIGLLEDLHRALWEPLEAELGPGAPVVVIPDEALFRVPFTALRDAETGRYLIEERALSVAPSLGIGAELPKRTPRPHGAPGRALVVAGASFDHRLFPELPLLPAGDREAEAIAALYAGARVLRGPEATPGRVLGELSAARLLHVASHALSRPKRPLESALVLAPGASVDDGLLSAGEIVEQPLDKLEVVVLAACRSGALGASRTEGVLGLTWPFLAGGVPAVVASLWEVGDNTSAELLLRFHEELAEGSDPVGALRQAQLERIAAGMPPGAWSAFEVFRSMSRIGNP